MCPGNPDGKLSLTNFNAQQVASKDSLLLDSPRSVRACLDLGLTPLEFIIPSFEAVVAKMRDDGEDITDATVTQMRYNYVVRRAKQKLRAAQEERTRLIVEESAEQHSTSGAPPAGEHSSKIQEEERKLQKIVENNKSRLRQQLLHAQLTAKRRQRESEHLEARRRADESLKRQRIKDMIEKSKKDEEAQALRNEARELELKEQQARVELRRAMFEAKDAEVKERIRQKHMEVEAENEAKRLINAERRRRMKEHADNVLRERRALFERKNIIFELKQEEYQHALEVKREQNRAVAHMKQQKIQEAIVRSNEQQEARVRRALRKEQQAAALRQKLEETSVIEKQRKAEQERESELQRQMVRREAQIREQKKIESLKNRIQTAEEHMAQVAAERRSQSRVRAEQHREIELDKLDCVLRSKRQEERRRESLLEMIDSKAHRVEMMQRDQLQLKEKRKAHREEAERSRVKIEEVTPGPLDFNSTIHTFGTEGPRWRMGLPAEALAKRVVLRSAPAPGYSASPGPCVYEFEKCTDARHRQPERFSVYRHERWSSTSEANITPGPQDYFPSSPSARRSRPSSSQL
jgi:hypothetical protein